MRTRTSSNLAAAPAAALAIALVLGHAAPAQEIPGTDSQTGHSRTDQLAYAFANVDSLLADWRSAWTSGDVDALARAYAPHALLVPAGGEAIAGREMIHAYLQERLGRAGRIGASIVEFDAREEIAFVRGDFRLAVPAADGPAAQSFGRHVTISMAYGGNWLIRAQFLLPASHGRRLDPPGEAAARLEPLTEDRLEGRTAQRSRRRAAYLRSAFVTTRTVLAQWSESWRRDDLDAVADAFTAEAVLVLPGEEPLSGREAIRSRFQDLLPGIGALYSTILDFDASGFMAYAYGRYSCGCLPESGEEELGY